MLQLKAGAFAAGLTLLIVLELRTPVPLDSGTFLMMYAAVTFGVAYAAAAYATDLQVWRYLTC